jgi:hypothetical protein
METGLIDKKTFLKLVQHERFVLPIQEVASSANRPYFAYSCSEVLEPLERIPVIRITPSYLGAKTINAELETCARDRENLNRVHWHRLTRALEEDEWDQLWAANPHRINVALACWELDLFKMSAAHER